MKMSRGIGFYNGDWFKVKEDNPLLYESIIRTIMTAPGERVMRPSYGAGIKSKVFAKMNASTLQDLAVAIHNSLAKEEPRLKITEVQTELAEENIIKIHVIFQQPSNISKTETITLKYNTGE
jgi:phage baseplate assembly protein W